MSRLNQKLILLFVLSLIILIRPQFAKAQSATTLENLSLFSLEDLLEMPVTSATGREQKLPEVSNAITVITKEDISRMGARSIQDIFVAVPGFHTTREDGHTYAFGIRSHTNVLNNDMLVLVDGVIVFNPAFSGTIWAAIPVTLDEIERVEVIRGAGGVLYSANAVSGVINFITKSAKDTQNYVNLEGGSQLYGSGALGLDLSPLKDKNFYLRGYYQYDTDEGMRKVGAKGKQNDDIQRHNFGFRSEYEFDEDTTLTTMFKNNYHEVHNLGLIPKTAPFKQYYGMTAASMNYETKVNDHYDYNLFTWYNHHTMSVFNTDDINIHAFAAKTQHNLYFDAAGKHIFSFGLEFLLNKLNASESILINPSNTQNIKSLFFQEEYRPSESLILSAGMRLDKNSNMKHKKLAWQPRLSAIYFPHDDHSIRLVFSRNIRQTSFGERDSNFLVNGVLTYTGNTDIDPVTSWMYEAGYRGYWLDKKIKTDFDFFVWYREDVVTTHISSATPTVLNIQNVGDSTRLGFESTIDYELTENIKIYGDYSYMNGEAHTSISSTAIQEQGSLAARHMIGTGLRYTKNKFKADIYFKYISKIVDISNPLQVLSNRENIEIGPNLHNRIRFAYEFTINKEQDITGEIELVGNDLFDHRRNESGRKYFIQPKYFIGLKIKF